MLFKKGLSSITIYDECYAAAESFHNSLKKLGFTVNEVSRNQQELLRFLNLEPALLVIRLDTYPQVLYELLAIIKARKPQLKILVHTIIQTDEHVKKLFSSGSNSVLYGDYCFRQLIDRIIHLEPFFAHLTEGFIHIGLKSNLHPHDPFAKIASDQKKFRLTKLLATGNSTKIIAQVLDSSETEIEMMRKKILHETNCRNVAEFIGKAKDKGII